MIFLLFLSLVWSPGPRFTVPLGMGGEVRTSNRESPPYCGVGEQPLARDHSGYTPTHPPDLKDYMAVTAREPVFGAGLVIPFWSFLDIGLQEGFWRGLWRFWGVLGRSLGGLRWSLRRLGSSWEGLRGSRKVQMGSFGKDFDGFLEIWGCPGPLDDQITDLLYSLC